MPCTMSRVDLQGTSPSEKMSGHRSIAEQTRKAYYRITNGRREVLYRCLVSREQGRYCRVSSRISGSGNKCDGLTHRVYQDASVVHGNSNPHSAEMVVVRPSSIVICMATQQSALPLCTAWSNKGC